MASVPVTLVGVAYTDKTGNPPTPVTIVAELYMTGLGVGGGPIVPPGQPPGIWGGGNVPMPTPPIHLGPGGDIGGPPGIGGGPIIPPTEPPTNPPDDNGFVKPPPEGGGWAYHEEYGWLYSPGGAAAGPKR